MRKKKLKTRIAKGVLLISFIILFARLIFSSINSWDHYKNNNNNNNNNKTYFSTTTVYNYNK